VVNRRHSLRRLLIMPPVPVSLEGVSDYLLFDLSEGGLSVYDRISPNGRRDFRIAFNLPGDLEPIKTRGEIAWVSKSRNRTGVRFTGLPSESRLRVKDWMATSLAPAPPYAADYEIDRPSRVSEFVYALRERSWRPNYLGKAALAIGILAGIFLFGLEISHSHSKLAQDVEPEEAPVAMAQTQPIAPDTSGNTVPKAVSRPRISKPPISNPAISNPPQAGEFVLQVGAMKQESNAVALSASLKQRGYPVIAFRHADGLYRIAVGPYPDMWFAVGVENDLKAQGFESFVRRWVPE
jgi:hypothetical protein